VSKKRNKNQRKKQTRARSVPRGSQGSSSSDAPEVFKLDARMERGYEAPKAEESVSSGGAIGRMREAMTHSEEGEEASLLHKRRSCSELLLWLVGGAVVFWIVTKAVVAVIDAGALPSK
jgi:hypothetical protein